MKSSLAGARRVSLAHARASGTVVSADAPPNFAIRIPALGGVRGIAILLVLLRHSLFGAQTNSLFFSRLLAAGQLS